MASNPLLVFLLYILLQNEFFLSNILLFFLPLYEPTHGQIKILSVMDRASIGSLDLCKQYN